MVRVHADPELARELTERFRTAGGSRPVAVTELIDLRRAFFRRVGPAVEIPPERRAALDAGRALHVVLGRALATRGQLEVRVRRPGLVGRIDLLADVPTEVKSTSASVDPGSLRELRPDQVEQLAMYCALLDRPAGRLLHLVVHEHAIEAVRAVDVDVQDPASIRAEMERRAGAFRAALESGHPDALPRCRWFGKGCEFQVAAVCPCAGSEPEVGGALLDRVGGFRPRTDVEGDVRAALGRVELPAGPVRIDRFRELLYPRRSWFDRTAPGGPASDETAPTSVTPDTYGRLVEAVESGPVGEVHAAPTLSDEPAEEVTTFREMPYLLRTSRAWARTEPGALVDRFPQYILELGFRAAATGSPRGRVIQAYERAERDEDRIAVFEVSFTSLTPFSRVWRGRADALASALRTNDPSGLLACPAWMYADCAYRDACGCGPAPARDQR